MMAAMKKKFVYNGIVLDDGPSWGMTSLIDGNMRFRWNETNENRNSFLSELCGPDRTPAAVELIHSKIIYDIADASETKGMQGDGIITRNRKIVPVVTVADCVPIFIYDMKSKVFGSLHSGWKGTGIVGEAVSMIVEKYESSPENMCIAIGPHIGDCCYNITEERAKFFIESFGCECVRKIDWDNWALSLTKANLAVLNRTGVPENNIVVFDPCTCCHRDGENPVYGSFRRQTLSLPAEMPFEERLMKFTVQAAYTIWD